MPREWRLGGMSLAAVAIAASFYSVPASADSSELDYAPIAKASAEPTSVRKGPALDDADTSCERKRGKNAGLVPRPRFPEDLGAPDDLAAFVDRTMCGQLDEAYIAGAAVTIVDGGRIAFSSGYGRARMADGTLVDPMSTVFRIGSISKLFTWTAVMQLAEQGLSLTADIREYLPAGLEIPTTYPQPITLRHLMTHTAGFEQNIGGIGLAPAGQPAPSLAETIVGHVPARARPPATTFTHGADAAYSNWGAALAGYIVERRSRIDFDDYVDRHIFDRLGMRHSSFREPLPEPLEVNASGAYRSADGFPTCTEPSVHGFAPASSGQGSAEDMGLFMKAHLNGGPPLMSESAARLLHSRAFSPHRHLAGATYGFNERYVNGRRLLWHAGVTRCFYAELYLYPEEKLGLFVAYNTYPLGTHKGALLKSFMDRYFPGTLPERQPMPDDAQTLAEYRGLYRSTSRSHETWEKIFDLTSAREVSVTADGFLLAPASAASAQLARWVLLHEEPAVLRRADGEETIAFVHEQGQTYLLGPWPFAPMTKLPWHATPVPNAVLVTLCALGFLAALGTTALLARTPHGRQYRSAGWLAAAAGTVNLSILACLALTIKHDAVDLMIALPWSLFAALMLSLASAVLSMGLAIVVLFGWINNAWTATARLGFTALAVPDLIFVGWLWYWNLIGFQLG